MSEIPAPRAARSPDGGFQGQFDAARNRQQVAQQPAPPLIADPRSLLGGPTILPYSPQFGYAPPTFGYAPPAFGYSSYGAPYPVAPQQPGFFGGFASAPGANGYLLQSLLAAITQLITLLTEGKTTLPSLPPNAIAPLFGEPGSTIARLPSAASPAFAPSPRGSDRYERLVSRPTSLAEYPRPDGDNGRGMHWIPTVHSTPNTVDHYVREAKEMGVKWMVFMNDHAQIGHNDYLIKQLKGADIEPIMRVWTLGGDPIEGDLGAMVRHAKQLGVNYYQIFNESNLSTENQGDPPSPSDYVDEWLPAAKTVIENGGLAGFGSLAPGGEYDDIEFLNEAFDIIVQRGEERVFNRSWLSMHNYTLNHPLSYTKDSNGFLKFRFYNDIVQEKLGRSIPIIGTEGGTHVGVRLDADFPETTEEMQVNIVVNAYKYMEDLREPYNFAYTYWVIANQLAGGDDEHFEWLALFQEGETSPIVEELKNLTRAKEAA